MAGTDGGAPLPRSFRTFRALIGMTAFFLLGAVLGALSQRHSSEPRIDVSMPYFPDCDALWSTQVGPDGVARTVSASERRNVVWKALNGDAAAIAASDDLIALHTAQVLFLMLHPGAPLDARFRGGQLYLRTPIELLTPEELAAIETAHRNNDPAGLGNGLIAMNRHDREAAAFMACVLRDNERLGAFIAGRPVPLEEVEARGVSP